MQARRAVAAVLAVASLGIVVGGCTWPFCLGPALELSDITWRRPTESWEIFGTVEGILYHHNCGTTFDTVEVTGWFYEASGAVTKHSAWLHDVRPGERRRRWKSGLRWALPR